MAVHTLCPSPWEVEAEGYMVKSTHCRILRCIKETDQSSTPFCHHEHVVSWAKALSSNCGRWQPGPERACSSEFHWVVSTWEPFCSSQKMTKSRDKKVPAVTCLDVTVNIQGLVRRNHGACLVVLLTEFQASSVVFMLSITKSCQGNVL